MAKAKPKTKVKPAHGRTATHVPTPETRKTVAMMVGLGARKEFIAEHLKIAKSTLEKHYAAEIKSGAETANLQVANHMFALTKKNVAAGVFWLVNRDGEHWKHVQTTRHEAGAGFNLEDIVKRSFGKGSDNAAGKPKQKNKS